MCQKEKQNRESQYRSKTVQEKKNTEEKLCSGKNKENKYRPIYI